MQNKPHIWYFFFHTSLSRDFFYFFVSQFFHVFFMIIFLEYKKKIWKKSVTIKNIYMTKIIIYMLAPGQSGQSGQNGQMTLEQLLSQNRPVRSSKINKFKTDAWTYYWKVRLLYCTYPSRSLRWRSWGWVSGLQWTIRLPPLCRWTA